MNPDATRSLTDYSLRWPTWEALVQLVTLEDYNTRVVLLGVTCLGVACGTVGAFLVLRKRALLSDALSHATLPGIGLAFLLMAAAGGTGKALPGLLAGAAAFGVLGVICVLLILRLTRIKEDAALGIVLSVFFGLGVAILGVIQHLDTGHAAGLKAFVYGKAASMLARDALLIATVAATVTLICLALFKEFTLLCFDAAYARAQGWPTAALDLVLMVTAVVVTVVGLQAVGLILVIALLILPPAAARFWTHNLAATVGTAAGLGGFSCLVGGGASALAARLPAGAVIVVVAGLVFLFSLVFGPARGLLVRGLAQRRLARAVAHQHLLRAMYELAETRGSGRREAGGTGPAGPGRATEITTAELLRRRSWTARELRRALRRARRAGEIVPAEAPDTFAMTPTGTQAAWRTVRNHRLWELYLLTHADVAPSHVDHGADEVEHVLDPDLVAELERVLAGRYPDLALPPSPHQLANATGA